MRYNRDNAYHITFCGICMVPGRARTTTQALGRPRHQRASGVPLAEQEEETGLEEFLEAEGLSCQVQEMDYLRTQIFFDIRQPCPNDFHFLFKAWIINPVVKASPFESVAQLARAIRGENDIRSVLRLYRP